MNATEIKRLAALLRQFADGHRAAHGTELLELATRSTDDEYETAWEMAAKMPHTSQTVEG